MVTGLGINSEWSADLKIAGTVTDKSGKPLARYFPDVVAAVANYLGMVPVLAHIDLLHKEIHP